ncbi:hypothetical protein KKR91_05655 [Arthrobacter jiangjiafuii]|uniref:Uncharacterized protein n=1 Tax=Arthrobacter jiangjiafuii TaxID=2817475 RepID=A0A975M6W4_9MICC|nr:hypothetical protein [Arthrobacter jiangjiafuii]MBP3044091.1 hypothetical protein [Arthrobacter jiangjiafuii]QWC11071.1 hypothetical protein KKR91_05655 [Arthrobacter jiangjiafuii]
MGETGALLVAGVFALSGCGSSSEAADSGSAESSPTPTLSVGQDQYTPEELEAALQAVKADEGLGGDIFNQETLAPLLEGTPDALAGVTVTPEQCDVLATTDIAGVLDNASMAILMLTATDSLTGRDRCPARDGLRRIPARARGSGPHRCSRSP